MPTISPSKKVDPFGFADFLLTAAGRQDGYEAALVSPIIIFAQIFWQPGKGHNVCLRKYLSSLGSVKGMNRAVIISREDVLDIALTILHNASTGQVLPELDRSTPMLQARINNHNYIASHLSKLRFSS